MKRHISSSTAWLDNSGELIAKSASSSWQKQLAQAYRTPQAVAKALGLPDNSLPTLPRGHFPLLVPRNFVARMRKADRAEALLRQILPDNREFTDAQGLKDPLFERDRQPVKGLIHKYQGRVLWLISSACAVHCRYCFRRNLPYQQMGAHPREADSVLAWLRAREDIHEVILSGGDPLALQDDILAPIVAQLATIPHLKSLRIHSRTPIVLPERVDEGLLKWMKSWQKRLVVVLHVNMAAEADEAFAQACDAMRNAGALLYSQTVLLRGVNDDLEELSALCHRLLDLRVQPYYLHLLDPVRGATHFDMPLAQAQKLYGELSATLPGYALPRLVRETPSMPAKTLVPPLY